MICKYIDGTAWGRLASGTKDSGPKQNESECKYQLGKGEISLTYIELQNSHVNLFAQAHNLVMFIAKADKSIGYKKWSMPENVQGSPKLHCESTPVLGSTQKVDKSLQMQLMVMDR